MENYNKRPLWQWVVIYLVIGLVVYAAVYFLFLKKGSGNSLYGSKSTETTIQASPSSVASPSSEIEKAVNIEYGDSGFVPASVTVKSGTTVNFINKSSRMMWVASDPHPAHTNLSEFDALKGYSQGESYSYTFLKIGNWSYHNHLAAKDTGTIIVEE